MGGGNSRYGRAPRALSPTERALWDRVAASTQRLHPNAGPQGDSTATGNEHPLVAPMRHAPSLIADMRQALATPPPTLRRKVQETTWDLAPPEVKPVGRPQAGLDRRTSEKMRRGNREPDARIDLHGMTAERAHRACLTFLSDAAGRGCRMVLVITGKGAREQGGVMRNGRGVLKASLPGWLKASPLRHSIVGIYQAHQRHGGEGAFYVYLKRRR